MTHPTLPPNPLLHPDPLPRWPEIDAEHVEPGMAIVLAEVSGWLTLLEADAALVGRGALTGAAAFERLAAGLERISERLETTWGAVGHLLSVRNSDALRAAHDKVQPAVVQFSLAVGQSRPLYEAWRALRTADGAAGLDPSQQRLVETNVRDAELAGIGLDGVMRERFNAIQTELAEAATTFQNHVLDATKAWGLDFDDVGLAAALPPSLRGLLAQMWSTTHEDLAPASADGGPWRVTLDGPVLVPFLQQCPRRDLREAAYRAHVQRASSGEHDNTVLVQRILALRHELAGLLGYPDYAALSLATKMAPDAATARRLLDDLHTASRPAAERDLGELVALARARSADEADDLRPWDVAFWAERLREARFDLTDEQLRPWFPLPRVLEGTFRLVERLFGVRIEAADGQASTWHADVRFFRVLDPDGRERAAFWLDPYSRPAEKRGGAWMNDCVGRSRRFALPGEPARIPVAHLVCNQTPPIGTQPSLMTFQEVETWLHELGHGLQHMLTDVDEGLHSGIRGVEWDAVELPSQFMENWAYDPPTARALSGHVETGAPIPEDLLAKLRAARTFRAGSDMLRQLLFGITDLCLHSGPPPADPFATYFGVAQSCTVLPPLPDDRFLCGFGHIFAGGYAAGYYGYKWAEVLSADAFGAFEEAGLGDDAAVRNLGRRFRATVLGLGGSVHPADVFRRFRGRDPEVAALLRHAGLGR